MTECRSRLRFSSDTSPLFSRYLPSTALTIERQEHRFRPRLSSESGLLVLVPTFNAYPNIPQA